MVEKARLSSGLQLVPIDIALAFVDRGRLVSPILPFPPAVLAKEDRGGNEFEVELLTDTIQWPAVMHRCDFHCRMLRPSGAVPQ